MKTMKKWEDQRLMKIHRERIQRARKVSRQRFYSSKQRNSSNHSILYGLLSEFGLQNIYNVKFIQKLNDYDQVKLKRLTPKQVVELAQEKKFSSKQLQKFIGMIDSIKKNTGKPPIKRRSISEQKIKRAAQNISYQKTPIKTTSRDQISLLKKQLRKAHGKINQLQAKLRQNFTQFQPEQKILPVLPPPSKEIFGECYYNRNVNKQDFGKSIDSWKMKSTLYNIDIQELTKCVSRSIMTQCSLEIQMTEIKVDPVFLQEPTVPDQRNIYNFIRILIQKLELDKEIPIIALIYMKRVLTNNQTVLMSQTWKRILFIALFVSAKVWDDQSLDNGQISMPNYPLVLINQLEKVFLQMIDYRLFVSNKEYAQTYFKLKTYAQKNDTSVNIRQLDVETVIKLQHEPNSLPPSAKNLYRSI